MKHNTSRRDFLKLASTLPIGLAASRLLKTIKMAHAQQDGKQNVLIIVFDAWSASNVSKYGYPRVTTPNIDRLAEQAIVYHRHQAGGNFTTPGTASLLTGTLPWTHRAFRGNGTVIEPFTTQNIFGAFKDHYRIAYTHNPWANTILQQFREVMDEDVPWFSLFLRSFDDEIIHKTFKNDDDIASVAWNRNVILNNDGIAYSLFLSHLYQFLRERNVASFKKLFPRGIPSIEDSYNNFILEDAVNWLSGRLPELPQPFLGYFHFLPPHEPYRTSKEFIDQFKGDGFQPVEKPEDVFTKNVSPKNLFQMRTEYDEFILYADQQFGILFDKLKESGVLENTWLVLTSDHGEIFERGINGHSTDAMYEPLLHIPLMIFEPGRTERMDVYDRTSAVDILPTLAHLTNQPLPSWTEGRVLPPFASADPERSIYSVRAIRNLQLAPLTRTTLPHYKGPYKLIYYLGYEEDRRLPETIQLFNLQDDPEELNDLSVSHKDVADEMLRELKSKLQEVNEPYL